MKLTKVFKTLALTLAATISLGGFAEAGCNWSGSFSSVPAPSTVPQSYKYVVNDINNNNSCRTGTFTTYGAIIAVRGHNAYAYSNIPNSLANDIKEAEKKGYRISDVHITESGNYIAIFGTNGYKAIGAPEAMYNSIAEIRGKGDAILSACFNDYGEYIIVTDDTVYYNLRNGGENYLYRARTEYGKILSASMTNNSAVFCCENGVYLMNAPKHIQQGLNSVNFTPRTVKYTDKGAYLITDGVGAYYYWL